MGRITFSLFYLTEYDSITYNSVKEVILWIIIHLSSWNFNLNTENLKEDGTNSWMAMLIAKKKLSKLRREWRRSRELYET